MYLAANPACLAEGPHPNARAGVIRAERRTEAEADIGILCRMQGLYAV
jgi:hypothetical protein